MPGDEAAAGRFPLNFNYTILLVKMKKQQHQLDITLRLRAPSADEPPDDKTQTLLADCRITLRQGKAGTLNLNAELTLAETPLARQLIRRLEWLDWPL